MYLFWAIFLYNMLIIRKVNSVKTQRYVIFFKIRVMCGVMQGKKNNRKFYRKVDFFQVRLIFYGSPLCFFWKNSYEKTAEAHTRILQTLPFKEMFFPRMHSLLQRLLPHLNYRLNILNQDTMSLWLQISMHVYKPHL